MTQEDVLVAPGPALEIAPKLGKADVPSTADNLNGLEGGSVLLRDDTPLPPDLGLNSKPWAPGWSRVTNFTPQSLADAIDAAGWTFFFTASPAQSSAMGFTLSTSAINAVLHELRKASENGFNCVEIEEVKRDTCLGISRITVTSRRRHIQADSTFVKTVPPGRQS